MSNILSKRTKCHALATKKIGFLSIYERIPPRLVGTKGACNENPSG